MGSKKFQKCRKFEKILEFCQKVSKVSGDSFMALYDPIVLEKKSRRKSRYHKETPPAYLPA